jgi:glutamyl-tRNA reductase
MLNDLILIHRNHGNSSLLPQGQDALVEGEVFLFKTCLRQVAIVDQMALNEIQDSLKSDDEVMSGTDAYRFMLEVVCGLRSPLLGETEVGGQFKLAAQTFSIPASPWGQQLQRFFKFLFEDAKRIRQNHLVDLGSQSYGSVLRREMKGLRQIHVLGAGHLVQETLPWFSKDGIEVHVHCRDVAKVKQALGERAGLFVHDLREKRNLETADALVVAAPVESKWVDEWLAHRKNLKLVADLRADSREDRLAPLFADPCMVYDLSQIFGRVSENQARLEARRAAALKEIDTVVRERNSHVEYRPFGWEDVCA